MALVQVLGKSFEKVTDVVGVINGLRVAHARFVCEMSDAVGSLQ
ncbi:hypothetical protein [Methylacidiphilum kamchatkense]|nr:hypothetical protein [Methylacidiphilum kamchatkense]